MAAGLYPLRRLQVGRETTSGSRVPATQQVIGEHEWTPIIDRYQEAYPRGVRVRHTPRDANQQRGSRLVVNTDCDFEHLLVPLSCGVVKPSRSGSGPFTHAFTPDLTARLNIDTLTAEYLVTDGSADHYEREFGYGAVERIRLTWASGQPTKLSYTIFGRREQASSITTGVGVVAGREIIPSALWSLAIDDTQANLGNSVLDGGHFRAGSLEIITGATPRYGIAGRADLDMNGIDTDLLAATLSLTVSHHGDAAAEYQHWRDDDLRFVRLQAASGAKRARIDLTGVYTTAPAMGQDGNTDTLTFAMALEHNPTVGGQAFAASVVNNLGGF